MSRHPLIYIWKKKSSIELELDTLFQSLTFIYMARTLDKTILVMALRKVCQNVHNAKTTAENILPYQYAQTVILYAVQMDGHTMCALTGPQLAVLSETMWNCAGNAPENRPGATWSANPWRNVTLNTLLLSGYQMRPKRESCIMTLNSNSLGHMPTLRPSNSRNLAECCTFTRLLRS